MTYTCPSCGQAWQRHEELAGSHTCSGPQPVIQDPRDAEIAKLREELAEARKVIRDMDEARKVLTRYAKAWGARTEREAEVAWAADAYGAQARAFLARKEAK